MIQIVGITIGAVIVFWQVGRNHRINIDLQRENYKEQLKLKIYETLADAIIDAQQSKAQLWTTVVTTHGKISSYWYQKKELHLNPSPINVRIHTLMNANETFGCSMSKLINNIERYEAALPKFDIFRKLFVIMSDIMRQAFINYYTMVIGYLPTDVPPELIDKLHAKVIEPRQPDDGVMQELKKLSDKFGKLSSDMGAYIYDLQIALQNHLIGSLFGRTLPPRKPADPQYKVIELGDDKIHEYAELIEKLEKERA